MRKKVNQLIINQNFQNLIPPLSLEELIALEASLKHEGCLHALVVWNNTIIDGHHRYAICSKHGISFKVVEKTELETELDVKLWMINNQFSRRNLPTETRLALAYRLKELEAQKAKERQGARNDLIKEYTNISKPVYTSSQDNKKTQNTEKGRALEAIAKKAGVSHMTAFQYDKIQQQGTEEQKAEVAEGKSSIKKVYTQIQKAERLEKNKAIEWPKGKYRVIYADPPWQYEDQRAGGNHGGAIDHYNTMSINELKNMPLSSLTEDNAVLFLWGTAPLLPEALELINAWGFKYKTNFIWDKVKHNMGHYNSVRHELLLIATKGSCTPDNVQLFDSVQSIERSDRHSEKPEEFRNIIETLYSYGNKLELFARKSAEGWEVFGNEI
jgi:N6-adenosine-specific RNA methylase IME4/ParB-like chromosome segregation protein Spo0J